MKKMIKGAVYTALGASVLTLAATANAADINVNIFGASAQAKFWHGAAPAFLEFDQGCAGVTTTGDDEGGMSVGTDCGAGHDNITVRYQPFNSMNGIKAVKGETVDPPCTAGEGMFIDGCQDVTVGASDVAGESFVQKSHGFPYGPLSDPAGGDAYLDIELAPVDTTGLDNGRPVVVPFSFFRTNEAGFDFTNMTPLMAKLLFSNQVNYWETLGIDPQSDGDTTLTDVTLCLRHAGSGTHATLDHAVMHGDANLVTDMDPTGGNGAIVWFNKGSSDLMRCLSSDGTVFDTDNPDVSLPWWTTPTDYAVGYADSDKCGSDAGPYKVSDTEHKCHDLVRLTYSGETGNRVGITTGRYDFWASQWLYYDAAELVAQGSTDVVADLIAFAGDSGNLDTYLPAKADFWATDDVMNVTKDSDTKIPRVK